MVRCFIMDRMQTYNLDELELWPHGEEREYTHTMLNSYPDLEGAVREFEKWSV